MTEFRNQLADFQSADAQSQSVEKFCLGPSEQQAKYAPESKDLYWFSLRYNDTQALLELRYTTLNSNLATTWLLRLSHQRF